MPVFENSSVLQIVGMNTLHVLHSRAVVVKKQELTSYIWSLTTRTELQFDCTKLPHVYTCTVPLFSFYNCIAHLFECHLLIFVCCLFDALKQRN